MSTRQDRTSGLASLFALIAGVAGIPVLLVALNGSPLPAHMPSMTHVGESLSNQITDAHLLGVLSAVCWLVWLAFCASVIIEVANWTQGLHLATVPVAGAFARKLVLSVALLFVTTQRPSIDLVQAITTPAIAPVLPGATTSNVVEIPVETISTSTEISTVPYTVAPRDDLWTLAGRHLGDSFRWRELFDLNKGRQQPDGRTLESPEMIHPGWVLQFPADAVGLGHANVPAPTVPSSPPSSSDDDATPSQSAAPDELALSSTNDEAHSESTEKQSSDTATDSIENGRHVDIKRVGLTATGVVIVLDQLRRRRMRHRRSGRRFQSTPSSSASTETLLRLSDSASQAQRLDVACRALAHCLSLGSIPVTARVDAVRVSDSEIEFLLDRPSNAPCGPFAIEADGLAWTLKADVHEVRVGAFAVEMSAPLPALVHIGSLDGADVLLDIERFGITAVDGPHCRTLTQMLVAQLATNPWADHIDIITVGFELTESIERIRHADSVDAIPALAIGMATATRTALKEAGLTSTFQGRATQDVNDGWIPTVIVMSSDVAHGAAFDSLVKAAGDGGQGLAIVVAGDVPSTQRRIHTDGEQTSVDVPELSLQSLPLQDDDVDAIRELLVNASHSPDIEYTLPAMPIDLRPIADVPAPTTLCVNVLGPVEVTGSQVPLDRSRSIETIAYLALHRGGVSDDRLKTALWPERMPTQGTFNSTISLARRQLGVDASGVSYLRPVTKGCYLVSDEVGSDIERFETLYAMAKSTAEDQAIRLLSGALELVRGAPFESTASGYLWAHTDGLIAQAQAVVADAAHELSQLHLAQGDTTAARWAARKGLLASPGYEVLYRDLMLACEVDGDLGALNAIMAELNALLDTVDPMDNLESETAQLFERIRGGRKRVAR